MINGKLIGKDKFNGIFCYEYSGDILSRSIKQNLKEARGIINHIALGSDIFIKFWKKENKYVLKPTIEDCNNDFYNIYKIGNLSFSYFISNLLEFTCSSQIDDRLWLLYPIEGTKESYRISTVCLE